MHSCATQRNECNTSPEDILLTDHRDLLCKWLCVFASEMRKEDGCQPRSIAQIFARLQCYINANKLEPVRIVDPMNPVCKPLHQLLDRLYCDLQAQKSLRRRGTDHICLPKHLYLRCSNIFCLLYFVTMGSILFCEVGKNNRQLKISQLNFRTVPDPDVAGKEIECVESKLPECAFQEDIFYWKARSTIPECADQPWYKVVQKFCPPSYKLLKPALLT